MKGRVKNSRPRPAIRGRGRVADLDRESCKSSEMIEADSPVDDDESERAGVAEGVVTKSPQQQAAKAYEAHFSEDKREGVGLEEVIHQGVGLGGQVSVDKGEGRRGVDGVETKER